MEVKSSRKRKRTNSEMYLETVRHFEGRTFTTQNLKRYSMRKFGIDITTRLPEINRLSRFKSLPKKPNRKTLSLKPVIDVPVLTEVKKQPGPFSVKIQRCGRKYSEESHYSSFPSQKYGNPEIPNGHEQQLHKQPSPTQQETDGDSDRKIGRGVSRIQKERHGPLSAKIQRYGQKDSEKSLSSSFQGQIYENLGIPTWNEQQSPTKQETDGDFDRKIGRDACRAHLEEVDRDSADHLFSGTVVTGREWVKNVMARQAVQGNQNVENASLHCGWFEEMRTRTVPTGHALPIDSPMVDNSHITPAALVNGQWDRLVNDQGAFKNRRRQRVTGAARARPQTRTTPQSRVNASGRRQEEEKRHGKRSMGKESNTTNRRNARSNSCVNGCKEEFVRFMDDSFSKIHVPCHETANSALLQKVRAETGRLRSTALLTVREYAEKTSETSRDFIVNQVSFVQHSLSEPVVSPKQEEALSRSKKIRLHHGPREMTRDYTDIPDIVSIRPSNTRERDSNRLKSKNICTQTSNACFNPENLPLRERPRNDEMMGEDVEIQ